MSEERKNAVELKDQALSKVAGGDSEIVPAVAFIVQWKCIACGICMEWCPEGAIYHNEDDNSYHVDQGKCSWCGECYSSCPVGAPTVQ